MNDRPVQAAPTPPTAGGSYIRKPDGTLDMVHRTEPAAEPVNRASPADPHPEPPKAEAEES
ncbi:MAG: hypothetical protein NTV97_03480 [Alphaproteobacteria bacterium]|nr:hypothetical protein [Alphaproteobacteria bacterium]